MTDKGLGAALDELKAKEGIRSDAALAKTLGVTRAFISAIRIGRKNVPEKLTHEVFTRLARNIASEGQLEDYVGTASASKYQSNLAVLTFALKRADGACELCHGPAPFLRANGEPFLEAHHITPLRDGGEDAVANVVMLCPNCHKKVHYHHSEHDTKKLLLVCKDLREISCE